jgi:hypothetical protein
MRSVDADGTGKLCERPVTPLSRSVPLAATTIDTSRGPPAGFAGHCPAPRFGTQRRRTTSLSRPFAVTAVADSTSVFDCFVPRLVCLSGSDTIVAGPHEPTVVGAWTPALTARLLSFTDDTSDGVHCGVVSTPAQSDTPKLQTPFVCPSTSQVGSPSWQSTPVGPRFAVTSGDVTCQAVKQSVFSGPPPWTYA